MPVLPFCLPSLPCLQALIPYYTGKIIDFASIDPDPRRFRDTTLKMLGVALGCAVFTGVRGGLFTVAMTRLNVRLRQQLFHSLMHQVGDPKCSREAAAAGGGVQHILR